MPMPVITIASVGSAVEARRSSMKECRKDVYTQGRRGENIRGGPGKAGLYQSTAGKSRENGEEPQRRRQAWTPEICRDRRLLAGE